MNDHLITDKGYLPSHTGLRGVICVVVMMYHFQVFFTGSNKTHLVLPTADMFFILSGFILSRQYQAAIASGLVTARQFIVRRVARLWPLYMFSIALFALVNHMYVQPYIDLKGLAWKALDMDSGPRMAYKILVQSLMIGDLGFMVMPWNGPAWSVSVEWIINLLFVLALVKVRLLYRPMLIILTMVCFFYLYHVSPYSMNLTIAEPWVFNPPVARGLMGFCMGAVIYTYLKTLPPININLLHGIEWALVINFVVLIFYASDSFEIGTDYVILFTIFMPIVVITLYRDSMIGRFVSYAPFTYLGRISYSIYLLHTPIGYWYQYAPYFKLGLGLPWTGLFYVALVIMAASVTYYVIERPFHKLGHKLTRN